jgi:translation elongation factor EF-1beta
LTIDTGKTKWVIDEFGFALAIAALVVAVIVWRSRGQVERVPADVSAVDGVFGVEVAAQAAR